MGLTIDQDKLVVGEYYFTTQGPTQEEVEHSFIICHKKAYLCFDNRGTKDPLPTLMGKYNFNVKCITEFRPATPKERFWLDESIKRSKGLKEEEIKFEKITNTYEIF